MRPRPRPPPFPPSAPPPSVRADARRGVGPPKSHPIRTHQFGRGRTSPNPQFFLVSRRPPG
uniref:Uncharacterized protein n=1 Tax=Arundo donax TaxID=35708 RepID=A0A0A9B145_ARUDO